MEMNRIHYVIGAFFIGYGTLYLLAFVGIVPLQQRSGLTLPAVLTAMQAAMIVFGVYYILAVRKKAKQSIQSD